MDFLYTRCIGSLVLFSYESSQSFSEEFDALLYTVLFGLALICITSCDWLISFFISFIVTFPNFLISHSLSDLPLFLAFLLVLGAFV